ncbi:MAG: GNAT family N-acetyltransferase, partial [Amphiplicatus sp.]
MKAEIVTPDALAPALIDRWREFQAGEPDLQSPFFSPEFTQAIGAARADAYVAVLEDAGEIVGFLPFHRRPGGVAKPIGGPISDYQGVIHAPGFAASGPALLKACGLNAYDFNHAPAAQKALAAGAVHRAVSPYIDLCDGYEAYVAGRPKAGKHAVKETERRIRKIEREIGPLRFVYHDASDEIWARLVSMKNDSYDRLGVATIFDVPWVARALEILRTTSNAHFAGLLTSVFAGERMIAGHFGMRSKTVWCWWFNSYDFEIKNYAPGLILILEAARRAPAEGLSKIDFGRGDQHYKTVFANGETALCEGSIETG